MSACDRERVDLVLADLADDRVHPREIGALVRYLVDRVEELVDRVAEIERRAGVRPAPAKAARPVAGKGKR